MKRPHYYLLILCFMLVGNQLNAQKGVTTFGIQYKPIVPNRLIGTFEEEFNADQFESSIKQKFGHSFGMVVRQGLNDIISLETGLVFTQRNFALNFAVPDSGYSAESSVGFVGYEIPIKGMAFIRLSEEVYMNTSLGASFNYYPSDVSVLLPIRLNEFFLQEGARLNRIQGAILANIGFEYRTKDKGYFYLGSSYNLPFASIVTFAMAYEFPPQDVVVRKNIRGSYLTLDLRYYFHEKPRSEQKR